MTYDEIIQQIGKRLLKHIYYINNGTTTNVADDNIGTIKISLKSDLIGTAIKSCEINVKEQLLGQVYVQVVASYQSYSQTKTYGPYNIKEETYDANSRSYNYVLYDNIIKTMVDYVPLEETIVNNNPLITYPCTVYQYFTALNTKMGFTTNISSLPNGSQTLDKDIYKDINFTYRDVYTDLAQANGVLLYLDNTVVKKATFGSHTVSIDDDILKNTNIDFGEHFGPINSIILSRSADSDKVFTKDDQSISQNGLCEFKISDNQMLNDNNRSDYLPALATQLFGIEYDIYDTELVGYGDISLLDEVNFETGDNEYSSFIFNDEITLTSGYKQVIYNEIPEESETDYKTSSETDKMIKQAYIIVDKQKAEINSVVQNVGTLTNLVNSQGEQINTLGTQITQTLSQVQVNITNIQDTLTNGVNLVKTTSVTIDDLGLSVSNDTSRINTTMTNNAFEIRTRGMTNALAFIGYDEVEGTSKAQMDNLRVTTYFITGYHRFEKMTGTRRTGIFYIGG